MPLMHSRYISKYDIQAHALHFLIHTKAKFKENCPVDLLAINLCWRPKWLQNQRRLTWNLFFWPFWRKLFLFVYIPFLCTGQNPNLACNTVPVKLCIYNNTHATDIIWSSEFLVRIFQWYLVYNIKKERKRYLIIQCSLTKYTTFITLLVLIA